MDRRNKKDLFDEWYQNYGNVYQFVYRCNYSVTDIQYRELLELLRMHCYLKSTEGKLFFVIREQMEEFLWEFQNELFLENTQNSSGGKVSVACKERISHTIVIENYYTSSLVYVPTNIQLDIEKVVYESGYIFSCGENIYCQSIASATYKEMECAIIRYLKKTNIPLEIQIYDLKKNFFSDKEYEDDFKDNSVVSLQIDSEHYYLKDISLSEAVKKLRNHEAMKQISLLGQKKDIFNKILWIFKDNCIPTEDKSILQSWYFASRILLVNKNVSYLFDTDHPAWNNTLIPHTFVSAMLNIGRGSGRKNSNIKVIDPLVGSGTMAVESAKYSESWFAGGDVNPNAQQMVKYNMDFFSMDYAKGTQLALLILFYMKDIHEEEFLSFYGKISDYQRKRIKILSETKNAEGRELERVATLKRIISDYANLFMKDTSEYEKSLEKMLKSLLITEREMFYVRFFVYLFRKAFLRHFRQTERPTLPQFKKAVFVEIKSIFFRVLDMRDILYQTEMHCVAKKENGELFFLMDGTMCVGVNYASRKNKTLVNRIYDNTDMRDFLKKYQNEEQKVDFIITDPPYGYNTNEQDDSLYELYHDLIIESVKSLKNGGQIIICLAARMHQGKRLPGFIKRDFVINLFREAAEKNQMYIVECDEEIRRIDKLYDFPFFWESKKVLRREVIRLQFYQKLND